MEPVRWGVISTARIGVEKVLPGMMKSRQLRMLAIASRDGKRARRWARKLGIPKAYGSYEELLADPEIEAIYNPLPNHLHVPLTAAAVQAGKHVLCEKPIAVTAGEAEALRNLPADRLVAEAFMVRHHPQWQEVRRRAASGALGQVHAILRCSSRATTSIPRTCATRPISAAAHCWTSAATPWSWAATSSAQSRSAPSA